MNSKSIISRLALFALGVGLFVGSATFAQTATTSQERALEPIAPFVNENTIMVARASVDGVDYDRLGETLQTLFNQAIVLAGFSQESIDACDVEFAKTLEAFKKDGKENVEKFKREQGVSSAYFVMQTIKGEGACFIIPAKDMSEKQVKKVVDFLQKGKNIKAALYKKSYILASPKPLKDLGKYYKNFTPGPNKKLDSFFATNADKFLAFYASRFKIRPLCTPSKEELEKKRQEILETVKESYLKNKAKDGNDDGENVEELFDPSRTTVLGFDPDNYDPFYNTPQCVKGVIEVFDTAFVSAQGYVDVDGLSANLTLEFNTAVNSGKFIEALENVIDEFVPLVFNRFQRFADLDYDVSLPGMDARSATNLAFVKEYRLAPLWREMTRGDLKRILPKSYDTKVVFDGSATEAMKKVGSNSVFVASLFAFLSAGSRQYFEQEFSAGAEEEFQPFEEEIKSVDEVPALPVDQTSEQAAEQVAEQTSDAANAEKTESSEKPEAEPTPAP